MNNSKIKELSPKLFNMIAAGEVVERPASVVKELVENSIDALATVIRIDLMNSGLDKITVVDNGIGMSKEDIEQAIKPHATSKIQTEEDLFSISTLGFRGEAIPSIASISKMRITSSVDGYKGFFKYFEAGTLINEDYTSFPRGTKIEVADIFYNTPARFKHLKSESTELSQITLLLNKISLAYPNISFILTNNVKVIFSTDGQNQILNNVSQIYGVDIAKKMIALSGKSGLYQIDGYITNNSIFRPNKNSIFIMINNRIIKNQNLYYAIMDGYKTLLPIGKYPIAIIRISCDPTLVDVNVHPTKEEVRFTDENELRHLITTSISSSLFSKEMIYEVDVEKEINPKINYEDSTIPKTKISYSWDDFKEKKLDDINTKFEFTNDKNDVSTSFLNENLDFSYELPKDEFQPVQMIENEKYNQQSFEMSLSSNKFSEMKYLGQFNKTYLLLEKDDTLYMIDQHAAMERVRYENVIDKLNHPSNTYYDLLIPIKIDLSLSEIQLLKQKESLINELGIKYEDFGNNQIIVRSIPTWINQQKFEDKNIDTNLVEIFTTIINDKTINRAVLFDNLAKIISCKSSIKANMNILEQEVKELLISLDQCQNPYTCPHGRPTIVKFSKYEIEKLFKRVI